MKVKQRHVNIFWVNIYSNEGVGKRNELLQHHKVIGTCAIHLHGLKVVRMGVSRTAALEKPMLFFQKRPNLAPSTRTRDPQPEPETLR